LRQFERKGGSTCPLAKNAGFERSGAGTQTDTNSSCFAGSATTQMMKLALRTANKKNIISAVQDPKGWFLTSGLTRYIPPVLLAIQTGG
jgi:hypothetical protein